MTFDSVSLDTKELALKVLFFLGIFGVASLYVSKSETPVMQQVEAKSSQQSSVQASANNSSVPNNTNKKVAVPNVSTNSAYKLTKWDDLLPASDLKALTSPQAINRPDQLGSTLSVKLDKPRNSYEKALVSVKVRHEYDKKKIKLPGFIVPIDIEGEGVTKTFFFVPFFGACLHLPPPPPNQIIYATFPKGYKVADLYQPYYIEAQIFTKQIKNDMATAAYTAKVANIYEYTE